MPLMFFLTSLPGMTERSHYVFQRRRKEFRVEGFRV